MQHLKCTDNHTYPCDARQLTAQVCVRRSATHRAGMRATLDSSPRAELDMAAVGEYAVGFRREKATYFAGGAARAGALRLVIVGRMRRMAQPICAVDCWTQPGPQRSLTCVA
jgi:hypothetical protein